MLPSEKKRQRLIKISAKTNPNYGKSPKDITANELLRTGFINLDKPSGPTSHQVVAWIKEILEVEKAGHGGTLDPRVTGVLPVAIGDATRALQVLLHSGKEYVALMKLHRKIDQKKIIEVGKDFVKDIYQKPPVKSAVKRVRRKRKIYYLDMLQIKETEVLFKVGCEAGTYIRTLCVDYGKKLGSGAHLAELRRTKVGKIYESDSKTLQNLKDAYIFWKEDGKEDEIKSIIQPMEKLLDGIPKIVIRDSAVDAICHGANLAVQGVVELDSNIKKEDIVSIMTQKGEGVAIAKTLMSTEQMIQNDKGICASLERVLMNKGTYPSIWKKS